MTKEKPGPRKQYDWEVIGKEWCLDQLSDRQLAKKYGMHHTTIARRAVRDGWVKDKGAEVLRKTNAALVKTVGGGNGDAPDSTTPTRTEIDAAVKNNVQLIREHRADISSGRALVALLSGQLKDAAENRDEIEEAIYDETKDDISTQRRTRMTKAVSLPAHAGVLRDLTTAMKNLIPLERQAFNLDKKQGDDPDPPNNKSKFATTEEVEAEMRRRGIPVEDL